MIHRFNETDGDGPNGGLIFDTKGQFYGTAGGGGINPRRPWWDGHRSSRAAAAQESPARQCREQSGGGPRPSKDGSQLRHRISTNIP